LRAKDEAQSSAPQGKNFRLDDGLQGEKKLVTAEVAGGKGG